MNRVLQFNSLNSTEYQNLLDEPEGSNEWGMDFEMNKLAAKTKLLNVRRLRNLFARKEMQFSDVVFSSREEFQAILTREKARADRNGHGFSLVAIEVSRKVDAFSLIKYFQNKIRRSDEIGWFDNKTLGILLYNTSANGAWQFVNKNSKSPADFFSMFKYSVYSYPNEWCDF